MLPLGDGSLPAWAWKLSLGLWAAVALLMALRETAQGPLFGGSGVDVYKRQGRGGGRL